MICDYFLNTYPLMRDFSVRITELIRQQVKEEWELCFVQTGLESKTATRLLKCQNNLRSKPFMVTYGDGVADISLSRSH